MAEMIASGWAGGRGSRYAANMWVKYKLTWEDFERLWGQQEGKCAGCLNGLAHPTDSTGPAGLKPDVDHNHETGKVRGVLCRKCNEFLGKVKDNKELLQRLQRYLERNGERL